MRLVAFAVPGAPRGKQRPAFDSRKVGKRAYTPKLTAGYEHEVQAAWMRAGRVDLGDGPLGGVITAVHRRPRDHWTTTGSLSAKGRREPVPICKPDADNVLKIVLDALHCPANEGRLAFADDTQITRVSFERRWALGDEHEHTDVRLWSITAVDGPAVLAPRAVADHAAAIAATLVAARGTPAEAVQLAELVLSLHHARLDGQPDPYAAGTTRQAAALLEAVCAHAHSAVRPSPDGHLLVIDDGRAFGVSLSIAPDGDVTVVTAAMA